MAPKTAKKSRNPDLIRGIGKYSRSATYHKRGLWAIKAKNGVVFPRHDKKSSTDEPPKFYPDDDVKKPLVNKRKPKPTKLRNVLLLYSLAGLTQSAFALGYEAGFICFQKARSVGHSDIQGTSNSSENLLALTSIYKRDDQNDWNFFSDKEENGGRRRLAGGAAAWELRTGECWYRRGILIQNKDQFQFQVLKSK